MRCLHLSSVLLLLLCLCCLQGCTQSSEESMPQSSFVDIKDIVFSKRSANCSDYAANYAAMGVLDIKRSTTFDNSITISVSNDTCTFAANSIPNHDFNDSSAQFATNVSAVSATYIIDATPTIAATITSLNMQYDDGVMLNGVKLDLLAAACYGVGDGMVGCGQTYMDRAWRKDPMSPLNNFGTDQHHAHTQPDGTYHYHATPTALYTATAPSAESPVVGFAPDGFPIFGPWISDGGTFRKVTASYRIKTGSRESLGTNEVAFPGGSYDGTYRQDYEYVSGLGDLDECNGRTDSDGHYGYYVTDTFPWVMACFKGTLHSSFKK